jgi:hypothetical protein
METLSRQLGFVASWFRALRVLLIVASICAAASARGAEQTWTGSISDSACGAKHVEAAENEGVMPDRDCTQACIRGGSLYVFVTDGKVYQIANQKNEEVIAHAGHRVKLTGELKDKTITVSKITMVDKP